MSFFYAEILLDSNYYNLETVYSQEITNVGILIVNIYTCKSILCTCALLLELFSFGRVKYCELVHFWKERQQILKEKKKEETHDFSIFLSGATF